MTLTPEDRTALRAAVEICDENDDGHGGGAYYSAIAAKIDTDEEVVLRKLMPRIAPYFDDELTGDDGIVVVRRPKERARQLIKDE
ncbi:hypothetical protein [Mycobacteroides chelonae]|uniref:hypothetical protein n=1 Tax=Mycobacteroides chelonae TaxID=1774 RepID=UPI00356B338D